MIIPLLAAAFAAQAATPVPPSLKLLPPAIEMGLFYSGVRMRIEGTVRPGSRALVVIRGGDRDEVFNRRGKVGPIWVNVGKVHVSGVPSLFLRFTSESLRSFLGRAAVDQYQLDESAIRNQMRLQPDADRDTIVASWLTLKSKEGTYALVRDGVKMGTEGPAGLPYAVEFHWPQKAPPGRYQAWVYECRNGEVTGVSTAELPVLKVGFPDWLARLASDRAALYGCVAVLAAALAGFGIDFLAALVFGKKRAVRH
jgi:hypothetical protein